MPNSTQPLAPCCPMFTNLENQLLCSWLQIPIHSCPWSANNYPLLVLPPFHTPQIKLQYLHRQHQKHQLSSSGTSIIHRWGGRPHQLTCELHNIGKKPRTKMSSV